MDLVILTWSNSICEIMMLKLYLEGRSLNGYRSLQLFMDSPGNRSETKGFFTSQINKFKFVNFWVISLK